jgi:erythromycin esterase-like protein
MHDVRSVVKAIERHAHPLHGEEADYDVLFDAIGDAPIVLLGEASHGTREFYRERARITRRLIEERGFTAVAVEADWPDAYRVNRYVHGRSADGSAEEALRDFERFPTWMWRNRTVVEFVEWLRSHNELVPEPLRKAGFYGLDLYSLYRSMEAVVGYLDAVDPEAAQRARYRYGCFEDFGEDPQSYGYAASFDMTEDCRETVLTQLQDMQRQAADYAARDGWVAEDEYFFAEQNARVAKNAEAYYRSMFRGRNESWNLRDTHMADTLNALVRHLSRHGGTAKAVVWAHNSHVGDARATEMGRRGELNIGQLARERYGRHAYNVGFTTYRGTVSAASNWDGPVERKRVRPGRPDSFEGLFHAVDIPDFLLVLSDENPATRALKLERLERAIGVIYRPETERISHYFEARLADQFNAAIHLDETEAVEPLERLPHWEAGEVPETYPSGL